MFCSPVMLDHFALPKRPTSCLYTHHPLSLDYLSLLLACKLKAHLTCCSSLGLTHESCFFSPPSHLCTAPPQVEEGSFLCCVSTALHSLGIGIAGAWPSSLPWPKVVQARKNYICHGHCHVLNLQWATFLFRDQKLCKP